MSAPAGRTALIIGASRGLGYALAAEYLARGWQVTATVRGAGRTGLHDLARSSAGRLVVETVDITIPEQVAALRDRLAQTKFDLLFVNAGVTNGPEETVADVTAEQANWWPPGTANSIGATYLHVVINTDVEMNRLIHRREPLVESKWNGDVGQGFAYYPDRFDRWVRHAAVEWDVLRDYGRAVDAAFVASL